MRIVAELLAAEAFKPCGAVLEGPPVPGRVYARRYHPSRAAGLERALDYIGKHKDVWFTRRTDIARHRIKTRPAPSC